MKRIPLLSAIFILTYSCWNYSSHQSSLYAYPVLHNRDNKSRRLVLTIQDVAVENNIYASFLPILDTLKTRSAAGLRQDLIIILCYKINIITKVDSHEYNPNRLYLYYSEETSYPKAVQIINRKVYTDLLDTYNEKLKGQTPNFIKIVVDGYMKEIVKKTVFDKNIGTMISDFLIFPDYEKGITQKSRDEFIRRLYTIYNNDAEIA